MKRQAWSQGLPPREPTPERTGTSVFNCRVSNTQLSAWHRAGVQQVSELERQECR